jgi:hypothetical protein
MSEYLPFWPKAAAGAFIATNPGTASVYSRALPTNGFTEVVVQMEIDAAFGADGSTKIDVIPQISNDGVNWKDLTSGLSINAIGTFPKEDTEKFTDIGAFMRMKMLFTNEDGINTRVFATLLVSATGRS